MIGDLSRYAGREQAYVKHFLLGEYLEIFAHKIGSAYSEIAYVDGFAGPWQNSGEAFEDTSFGIALAALTRAKATWKELGRNFKVSAYLVEQNPTAYVNLQSVRALFPNVEIKTYSGSFINRAPELLKDIPDRAFAFLFIDPKGWAVDMQRIGPLLRRPNSEVVFNFMFDFINRFAELPKPQVAASLNRLLVTPGWRARLAATPKEGMSQADHRKAVLVDAFAATLRSLGGYAHVAETTILRPTQERPLYSLVYGTRSVTGLEVFRDCQIKALREQSQVRGVAKLNAVAAASRQNELFGSLSDMTPDPTTDFLHGERRAAGEVLLNLVPTAPDVVRWAEVWPQVLARVIVTRAQVNALAADLRKSGALTFPDWEARKRVPGDGYRLFRP
ncbi:three-Cys-motif partner protein TcmP [Brevundimonas diminuta]|uniref:three-Cys-motif partner protein TcmP n=1 Tax=Brevundimonas diminuta TaxID=293 RepID=UPI00320865D5